MGRVFRYEISPDLLRPLREFAVENAGSSPKEYRVAWASWVDTHEDAVTAECIRLEKLGFAGNSLDKLAKAARYYLSRPAQPKTRSEETCPRVSTSVAFQKAAKAHVTTALASADPPRPAISYEDFCRTNTDILRNEVARLLDLMIDTNAIVVRLRKAYQNCYSRLRSALD